MSLREIESQALQLPLEQRAALSQHLIASLDEADAVASEWADEAARRADGIRDRTATSVAAADVFADARRVRP